VVSFDKSFSQTNGERDNTPTCDPFLDRIFDDKAEVQLNVVSLRPTTQPQYPTSSPRPTIVIVSRPALLAEALAALIARQLGVHVTTCSTLSDALNRASQPNVRCVAVHFQIREETLCVFEERLRALSQRTSVLLLADSIPASVGVRLQDAGAVGIMSLMAPTHVVMEGLRSLAGGRSFRQLEPVNITSLERKRPALTFTERQKYVLRLVYQGYLNKEIAVELGVSNNSVKSTIQQLFRKLAVRSRGQLVRAVLLKIPYVLEVESEAELTCSHGLP